MSGGSRHRVTRHGHTPERLCQVVKVAPELSAIVRLSYDGETQEEISEATGRGDQRAVSRWGLSHRDEFPNLKHVLIASRHPKGAAWARRLASRFNALIASQAGDGLDHHARLARLTVELTDVLRSYSAGLADKHMDGPDTADLVRELVGAREAIDDALAELSTQESA